MWRILRQDRLNSATASKLEDIQFSIFSRIVHCLFVQDLFIISFHSHRIAFLIDSLVILSLQSKNARTRDRIILTVPPLALIVAAFAFLSIHAFAHDKDSHAEQTGILNSLLN